MGVFRIKTYRKRLTGAVRSILHYSKVNSGRSGEKTNLDFCWPLLGPISNHIGPNLILSGTKSPNLYMYLSSCYRQLSVVYLSYPKTHISRFFWLPAIYGPGSNVYLSTRYLWVSVDQISMDIWWPDIHEYLWYHSFLPGGKAVANLLTAIPVLKKNKNNCWRFIIFFGH